MIPFGHHCLYANLSRDMEGMRHLLGGKSLRVVKRLVGDILGF